MLLVLLIPHLHLRSENFSQRLNLLVITSVNVSEPSNLDQTVTVYLNKAPNEADMTPEFRIEKLAALQM